MNKIFLFLKGHIVLIFSLVLLSLVIGGALEFRKLYILATPPQPKIFPPDILTQKPSSSSGTLSDSISQTPSMTTTPDPASTDVLGTSTDNSANTSDNAVNDSSNYVPSIPTSPPAPVTFGIDISHSSLNGNSPPADNSSKASVNVSLKNISGGGLGGLNVSLSTADNAVNFYPSSAPTNSSGDVSFTATSYSSVAESVNVNVTSGGHSYTIPALGTITFTSLGSSSTSNNTPSCTNIGVPTADNSEVYDPSGSIDVGSTGTVTVELLDCNNSLTGVSDTLDIRQSSGGSGLLVNGDSLPLSLSTTNGKLTFSVGALNSGTYSFTIQDTTHNFSVTAPYYATPSVTFSGSSSTPAPTQAPTSGPTETPTSTPIPSPTAILTPDATPSP